MKCFNSENNALNVGERRMSVSLNKSVWGDGLVEDTLGDFSSVTSWKFCSNDEYILLFPQLVSAEGPVPANIRDHLTVCVAVWALRMQQTCSDDILKALKSVSRDEVEELGLIHQDSWFGANVGWMTILMDLIGYNRRVGCCPDDVADLLLLDQVLWHLRSGACYTFNRDSSAQFSFLSGILPAYVSADAVSFHERDTVAGWLGYLSRGRAALIPASVAEYLLDVIEMRSGRVISIRDPAIARMICCRGDWETIRRAATLRLRGVDRVLRCRTTPVCRGRSSLSTLGGLRELRHAAQ